MNICKVELGQIGGVLDLIDEFDRAKSIRPTVDEVEAIFASIVNSGGCVVGAFDDDSIIGTCSINICSNFSWSGRPYAIIENVIVTENQRGKGVGKALLAYAKEYAFSLGCYKVSLMTGSKKPETLKFYESAGFLGDKTGFQIRNHA